MKRRGFTKLEMFSPARIALMRECRKHPALMEKLEIYKQDEWTEILGEVAAHLNIIIDGLYLPDELDRMAGKLYDELKKSRSIIIH